MRLNGDIKKYRMLIVFAIIAAIFPLFVREYTIHMMIMMLFFAYLAEAWNLIGGFAGQFALGNGVYIGIGGYIVACLFKYNGITPWAALIIAGIITGIIGVLVSYPCFKLRGTYYALATAAVLYAVKYFFTANDTILGYKTGGALGIKLAYEGGFWKMQFVHKLPYYYIMLGLLVIVILVSIYIKNSKSGFYYAAISTNQDAARTLGVNATYYKMTAQFLSSFFTAIGGGFYVVYIMYIDPTRVLSYSMSIQILLYAIVGGADTIWGPVLGGLVLYPLNETLRTAIGTSGAGISTALYGVLLMLVIAFMPSGVLPWINDKVKLYLRNHPDKFKFLKKNQKAEEV